MPESDPPRKTPIQEAVINLRHALGLTQERFAAALGVGLVTVARWETSRTPAGTSLARLEVLAMHNRRPEFADIFHQAQLKEASRLMQSEPEEEEEGAGS